MTCHPIALGWAIVIIGHGLSTRQYDLRGRLGHALDEYCAQTGRAICETTDQVRAILIEALEHTERSGPRFPAFTSALMIAYATPAERTAWEAAARLEIERATFERAIAEVYDATV